MRRAGALDGRLYTLAVRRAPSALRRGRRVLIRRQGGGTAHRPSRRPAASLWRWGAGKGGPVTALQSQARPYRGSRARACDRVAVASSRLRLQMRGSAPHPFRRRPGAAETGAASGGFRGQWTMVVAQLLDFAVHDFEHLGAERLVNLVKARPRAMEERLRDATPVVAGAYAQIAAAVGKQRETGLVMAPHLVASLVTHSSTIDDERRLVEAFHHALDIMAVEGVEVAPDQLFFLGHMRLRS